MDEEGERSALERFAGPNPRRADFKKQVAQIDHAKLIRRRPIVFLKRLGHRGPNKDKPVIMPSSYISREGLNPKKSQPIEDSWTVSTAQSSGELIHWFPRRLHPVAVLLLLVLTVIILAALYFRMFVEFPRSADEAGAYLAATDIATGNWQLKGWWWGSDTYWTSDLAFEALLIRLLGHHPIITVLVPAFNWAGTVLLSILACRAGVSKRLSALLPVAVVIAIPILRDNWPMPEIAQAPLHVGSILYILTMFLLVPIASTMGSKAVYALVALDVVTALAVAGDPLALVIGVGSVVVVTTLASVRLGDRRQALVLVNIVGAALLGKLIETLNTAFGGIHPSAAPLTFVAFDELGRNISLTVQSFLILTGSNFFGRDLWAAVLYLMRFPILLAMVGVLYIAGLRFIRYALGMHRNLKPNLLDQLLLVAIVINILSGVTSGILVDIMTARYFLPAVVFLAILTGRTLPAVRSITVYGSFALIASLFAVGISYARIPPRFSLIAPRVQELGDFLIRHQLTEGYAQYWSASIVTMATRGAVHVGGVITDGAGKVVPFLWVSKEEWYKAFGRRDRPFFIVIDMRNSAPELQEGSITATFGAPARQYDLPGYKIVVFYPQ